MVNELKSELQSVNIENRELHAKLRESNSKLSIYRSEIAELKAICTESNNSRSLYLVKFRPQKIHQS